MDASDEIVEVAKAAQAHEFIIGVEDGYDTIVGERGVGYQAVRSSV
jgi:ABC-type multidrug transport system fused ATPase/permease subunit